MAIATTKAVAESLKIGSTQVAYLSLDAIVRMRATGGRAQRILREHRLQNINEHVIDSHNQLAKTN
jgi:hypothetical protein